MFTAFMQNELCVMKIWALTQCNKQHAMIPCSPNLTAVGTPGSIAATLLQTCVLYSSNAGTCDFFLFDKGLHILDLKSKILDASFFENLGHFVADLLLISPSNNMQM
jgi:hypothetical protein